MYKFNNKYVIFCVESSAFNNDISMNGGHYIIATSINNNDIDIINPRKDKYEIMTITIDKLILCTKNYGSWRILINN